MARERILGFTKAQRMWILERDGHQCSFMTYDAASGKWLRCGNKTHLQVHHITPRGFYDCHLRGCGWDVNSPENGITLCAFHHVGEDTRNEHKPYIIHWDTRMARKNYRGKGPNSSFEKMMARRVELNQKLGRPYWNTRWDWLFGLLVTMRNRKFRRPFPAKKNANYAEKEQNGAFFQTD